MDVIAHQPRSTICNPLSIFRARGSQQTRLVWSEEVPGAAPGRATIFCIILRSSIAEHPFDKWKTAAQYRAEGPCFRRLKIEDRGFQIFEGIAAPGIFNPRYSIDNPSSSSRGARDLHAAVRRRRFEVQVLAGAPFSNVDHVVTVSIPPCEGGSAGASPVGQPRFQNRARGEESSHRPAKPKHPVQVRGARPHFQQPCSSISQSIRL